MTEVTVDLDTLLEAGSVVLSLAGATAVAYRRTWGFKAMLLGSVGLAWWSSRGGHVWIFAQAAAFSLINLAGIFNADRPPKGDSVPTADCPAHADGIHRHEAWSMAYADSDEGGVMFHDCECGRKA